MLLLLSMQLPGHAAPSGLCAALPGHAALLRMLLSHWHAAKARKYIFKCSIHGPLIRQIGIYIMGGFSKSGSQFKFLHTIQKNILDIHQYIFYKYFFSQKFLLSHHINIFFHFSFHFSSFRIISLWKIYTICICRILAETLSNCLQHFSIKIFENGYMYPKSIFPVNYVV